ncbi:protein-L-isoaspartate O-methyltransferase [Patescibacteria group bacterium]|nr:protein-L-isoaspartate O-methyltransferase [Patescibacteria group bacterium]
MKQMIKDLISSGALKTPRIIEAFQRIDRKDFLLEEYKDEAYVNAPLSIGYGQTISQPLTVAFMLELLQPQEGNKILDIGSGSGWQTALLADIVGDSLTCEGRVFAIEIIPELANFGRKNVSKYNFIKKGIVKFFNINGANGLLEEAPFDRIIAAATGEEIPRAWKEQLKIGGRLVAPVKDSIQLLVKKEDNVFEEQSYSGFAFVPFVDN